jgi:hypothetical protein
MFENGCPIEKDEKAEMQYCFAHCLDLIDKKAEKKCEYHYKSMKGFGYILIKCAEIT